MRQGAAQQLRRCSLERAWWRVSVAESGEVSPEEQCQQLPWPLSSPAKLIDNQSLVLADHLSDRNYISRGSNVPKFISQSNIPAPPREWPWRYLTPIHLVPSRINVLSHHLRAHRRQSHRIDLQCPSLKGACPQMPATVEIDGSAPHPVDHGPQGKLGEFEIQSLHQACVGSSPFPSPSSRLVTRSLSVFLDSC
jgi:hypothetical protein